MTSLLSTSAVTNWRSSSERCAVVTIAQRGLPSDVYSIDPMSNGGPSAQAANDGEASSPLSLRASSMRASCGKNWSSSNTPSLRIGGLPTMPTSDRQVERASLAPGVGDQVREQDVLAARQRVGADADETEQPGDVALDLVADELGIARVGRHLERADDVDRDARSRPGRVDREVRRRLQRGDVRPRQSPSRQSLAPGLGLLGGEGVGSETLGRGLAFVDPRTEVGRLQRRKREAQVGEIALGIDHQRRPPRGEHLLDEHDAEAGLARARHADDHAVRGQVVGVDADVVAGAVVGRRVDLPAQEQLSHGRTVVAVRSLPPVVGLGANGRPP